jgi:hypothetical protein
MEEAEKSRQASCIENLECREEETTLDLAIQTARRQVMVAEVGFSFSQHSTLNTQLLRK